MGLIPCTMDCIYERCGVCFLDRAVSAGSPENGECAYFIRRASRHAAANTVNKSNPDAE